MEHACPKCGLVHEGELLAKVWHSRCSNCGALNGASTTAIEEADCRRCGKVGTLVALDDIPDAVGRYPGLTKTERGYEVIEAPV